MKRIITAGIIAAVSLSAATSLAADNDKVTVNMYGEELKFDVEPVIDNGRTLVPFRAIFEKMGCYVDYSVEEGKMYVIAVRGFDNLYMVIGENEMEFNGETISLDVPAKIVDDRTLVPLRAVSEAFSTKVEWDGDTKTVTLKPTMGEHEIIPQTIQKTIKADDGQPLMEISASYPIIKGDGEFISKLNAEYKANAETFVAEEEKNAEDAKLLHEQNSAVIPFIAHLTYEVNTDKDNIVSITNFNLVYYGGAHNTLFRDSRNFDMKTGKEFTHNDVFLNNEQDDMYVGFYDMFTAAEEEIMGEDFNADWAKQLEEEIKNVKFYLTDDSAVLYFDSGVVAPYAYGSIEVPVELSAGSIAPAMKKGESAAGADKSVLEEIKSKL